MAQALINVPARAKRGEVITVVPCTVGKIVPDATPEEEWQWAVDSMKACYEHGLREGIRIAVSTAAMICAGPSV